MPLIECAIRNTTSIDSTPCGIFSSSSRALLISAKCSVDSSMKIVRYFARSTLGLALLEHLVERRDHRVGLVCLHDEVARARLERLLDQRLLSERAAHHDARGGIEIHDP